MSDPMSAGRTRFDADVAVRLLYRGVERRRGLGMTAGELATIELFIRQLFGPRTEEEVGEDYNERVLAEVKRRDKENEGGLSGESSTVRQGETAPDEEQAGV